MRETSCILMVGMGLRRRSPRGRIRISEERARRKTPLLIMSTVLKAPSVRLQGIAMVVVMMTKYSLLGASVWTTMTGVRSAGMTTVSQMLLLMMIQEGVMK